jgi:hypothetical protein
MSNKKEGKKDQKGAKPLVAGAIAGAVDTCITMPLDTLKTQFQLQSHKNLRTLTRSIIEASGVRGLYAGFFPFLVQASGKASVRFFSYYSLCAAIDSVGIDRSKNAASWSFACGSVAGMLEALLWTTPSERVKVMQQAAATKAGSNRVTFMDVLRTQGIRGVYVGAIPTALRQGSSVAIRFTVVEQLQGLSKRVTKSDGSAYLPAPAVSFLAGGIGGGLSVVFNNPIDVLKSRIQAGFKGGMLSCAKDVYQTRGILAFGSGLTLRVPRLFLSQAIQFMVVDETLKLMEKFGM